MRVQKRVQKASVKGCNRPLAPPIGWRVRAHAAVCAGKRTTKRAPRPSSGGSSVTVPVVGLGHGAHDREPEAGRADAVAGAAEEALEDLVVQLRRDARARRPRRRARPAPLRALDAAPRPPCPGRCGAARSPSGSAPAGAARRARPSIVDARRAPRSEISWSPATGSSSAAASVTTLGEVDRRVRRLAAGVGAREQQQVGDQPAHPARGAQRGGGGLALLARRASPRAARGWPAPRSAACAARARRRRRTRAGARASPRSPRAPRRARASIASSVRASSATSSSASGRGIRTRRVARALDLARGGGQLGDRLHRAARGGEAGQQRERGAAEHAEAEEQLHAVGGRLRRRRAGARTGR